jgi:hypothetical protein
MGSWVSASYGYGIAVPSGEEDEYEPGRFLVVSYG